MRAYLGQDNQASREHWHRLLTEPPAVIAVDTETVSLENRLLLGIGLATNEHAFFVSRGDDDFLQAIKLIRDPSITKVYHNAPYDLRVLRAFDPDLTHVHDTAIMCRLCGVPASLGDAYFALWPAAYAEAPRGMKSYLEEYQVKEADKLPPEILAGKCARDARSTWLIWQELEDKVNTEYYQIELRVLRLIELISRVGLKLDQERRAELETLYTRDLQYYRELANGLGFNPGSPLEVGYMIASAGAFLPFTKAKTRLATDEVNLRKVKDPPRAAAIAQLTLDYRHVQKMLGTYLVPLRRQDRAYTTLHLDAITGRISGTSAGKDNPDRNLLNIPKKVERGNRDTVRSIFVNDEWPGKDGFFTSADESQAEMRILAYIAQDETMLKVFREGGDIHLNTELSIWGTKGVHRTEAKVFNYGMGYSGGDIKTVADNIGSNDYAKIKSWIDMWMQTYPQIAQWMQQQVLQGRQQGWVSTLGGRKMMLPIDQGEKHADNCAINYPIQGTAAEIFKRQLLALENTLPQMRLLVHDEFLWQGPVELPSGIEDIMQVHIPLQVSRKERWG